MLTVYHQNQRVCRIYFCPASELDAKFGAKTKLYNYDNVFVIKDSLIFI